MSRRTFLLESEVICEMSAFMVAADEEKRLRIQNLITVQEHDALEGEVASIHVVSEKEVGC